MARRRTANQKYHDRVAGKYEHIYDDVYWQWHDALTWDYIKQHLPRDLSVPIIDLGCGPGKWGRKLLKSGYHVTFVDLSHGMVDEARKQVEANEGTAKAGFLQADLVDLSGLPSDHYGFATAIGEPIGNTGDQRRAVREIARIMRPGGVCIATFDNRIACIDHYIEKGDLPGLEQFLKTGRTRWLTRDPSEQFEMHTSTPDEVAKLFTQAGFEVIETLGKTILPMRHHLELLADATDRRRWAKLEQRLARDPHNWARCAHLQIAARLPSEDKVSR